MPAYFIHPCNTSDAVQGVVEDSACTPSEYLLVWLGLIGSSVGLHVTTELAEEIMDKGRYPETVG